MLSRQLKVASVLIFFAFCSIQPSLTWPHRFPKENGPTSPIFSSDVRESIGLGRGCVCARVCIFVYFLVSPSCCLQPRRTLFGSAIPAVFLRLLCAVFWELSSRLPYFINPTYSLFMDYCLGVWRQELPGKRCMAGNFFDRWQVWKYLDSTITPLDGLARIIIRVLEFFFFQNFEDIFLLYSSSQ